MAVQAHVPSFLTITTMTARQIDDWAADNIHARDQLPVLLRLLINSTGTELRRVDFPGYDNAQRPGWDGWVEAGAATPSILRGQFGLGTQHQSSPRREG